MQVEQVVAVAAEVVVVMVARDGGAQHLLSARREMSDSDRCAFRDAAAAARAAAS